MMNESTKMVNMSVLMSSIAFQCDSGGIFTDKVVVSIIVLLLMKPRRFSVVDGTSPNIVRNIPRVYGLTD